MKTSFRLIFLLFIFSCSANRNSIESNINSHSNQSNRFFKDSVHILSPEIEIKEYSNGVFFLHPEKRELLKELTINTLRSKFPNSKYFELPLMSKDYRTINSVIEGRFSINKRSWKPIKAPDELLINEEKYTILISINGYFGDLNRGVLMIYLINNESKTWDLIERYEYNNSPLDMEKTKKLILRALDKIVKRFDNF